MIGNYLLTAFRNLLKHKYYTLINTAGLGIGIAVVIRASLFVRYELAYDTYHANSVGQQVGDRCVYDRK